MIESEKKITILSNTHITFQTGEPYLRNRTQYLSAAVWKRGSREINEDAFCIWHMMKNQKQYLLAIVCDGIGGLMEGEQASSYLVFSLRKKIRQMLLEQPHAISKKQMKRELLRELYQIHETLKDYGRRQRIGIGTTLSFLLIYDKYVFLCNVGDSRIYTGNRYLKQYGKDDRNRQRALTKAIGRGTYAVSSIKCRHVRKNQSFLLCSDGFYHTNLTFIQQKIPRFTSESDIQLKLNKCYAKAVTQKETDNITAIFIQQTNRKRKGKKYGK